MGIPPGEVLSLAYWGRFGSLKLDFCDLWFRMVSGNIPDQAVIVSVMSSDESKEPGR